MDEVWENFIRSLDPVVLERERLGAVGNEERPGSAAHNEMLVLHGMNRAKFVRERRQANLIIREGRKAT